MLKRIGSNVRLQTHDITDQLALISLVIAHLTRPIDQLDPLHPFVHGQLDLPGKVVQMSRQAGHDLLHPRGCLWSHGIDDMLGEVGIEARGARLFAVHVGGRAAHSWIDQCDGRIRDLRVSSSKDATQLEGDEVDEVGC